MRKSTWVVFEILATSDAEFKIILLKCQGKINPSKSWWRQSIFNFLVMFSKVAINYSGYWLPLYKLVTWLELRPLYRRKHFSIFLWTWTTQSWHSILGSMHNIRPAGQIWPAKPQIKFSLLLSLIKTILNVMKNINFDSWICQKKLARHEILVVNPCSNL